MNFFEDVFPLQDLNNPFLYSNPPSYMPSNASDNPTSSQTSHPFTNPSTNTNTQTLKKPIRNCVPPTYSQDYICNNLTFDAFCNHIVTNHDINPIIPKIPFFPTSSNSSYAFHVSTHPTEPSFYHQAKGIPEWEYAMKLELDAFQANGTWDIIKLPKGKQPIACRWVYKVKYRSYGSIKRHKAHLVTKGFT